MKKLLHLVGYLHRCIIHGMNDVKSAVLLLKHRQDEKYMKQERGFYTFCSVLHLRFCTVQGKR